MALNIPLTPPLGSDRFSRTPMEYIRDERTQEGLKRKLVSTLGPDLSKVVVKNIKLNPEPPQGQNIQDYIATTADIPARDTSKLNCEVDLAIVITPLEVYTNLSIPGSKSSYLFQSLDSKEATLLQKSEDQDMVNCEADLATVITPLESLDSKEATLLQKSENQDTSLDSKVATLIQKGKDQDTLNEILIRKIDAQDQKIEALSSHIEDNLIPMYWVNLQTQFVKKICCLLGSKLTNEENAGNDKKHSVTRYERFASHLSEKMFKKACPNLDLKHYTMLKNNYRTLIRVRNGMAHETEGLFARWLKSDEGRSKPHSHSWVELLEYVYNKEVGELAAQPLPFSGLTENMMKPYLKSNSNHAQFRTGQGHSPKGPNQNIEEPALSGDSNSARFLSGEHHSPQGQNPRREKTWPRHGKNPRRGR